MSKKNEPSGNHPVELIESELDDVTGAGDSDLGGGTLKSLVSMNTTGKAYFTSVSTKVKVEGKNTSVVGSLSTSNANTTPTTSEDPPTEQE